MIRLEITRTLSAPPERVWRAFTDPRALAAWFWPHLNNTVEIDLRTGGRYRITGPAAGIAVSGEYVEVTAPTRLVFTWQFDDEPAPSRVTITLSASGGHTVLSLVHERISDDATRDQFAQGWHDCLDRLSDALAAP
jgi:uncharacterized protein YndB with AHSA1/START domain